MNKKKTGLARRAIRLLDLPEELDPATPRLTVHGRGDMLLENHMGVLCYAADEVQLLTGAGTLTVTGEGLTLCLLAREQVYISGELHTWGYDLKTEN